MFLWDDVYKMTRHRLWRSYWDSFLLRVYAALVHLLFASQNPICFTILFLAGESQSLMVNRAFLSHDSPYPTRSGKKNLERGGAQLCFLVFNLQELESYHVLPSGKLTVCELENGLWYS